MIKVQMPSGLKFDAVQWCGDLTELPGWLGHCHVDEDKFHGALLMGVGHYRVKPGSWVLKSDNQREDIFPVRGDLMWDNYTKVEETKA